MRKRFLATTMVIMLCMSIFTSCNKQSDSGKKVDKTNISNMVNDTTDTELEITLDEKKQKRYKFVAKTHRLAYGMKATYIFYLSFT